MMISSALSHDHTWVILPSYNEARYVGRVLEKVKKLTKQIIVVDDGSKDATAEIAREYVDHVLVHRINLGKGAALKTGADYAFAHLDAQAVIFMDSDDQHDANELSLFTDEIQRGAEVVFGIRHLPHMPFLKKIGNSFASVCVQALFGTYIPDIPSGYKAFSKQAYQKLRWQASGYEVELEIAARVAKEQLRFAVVPVKTIYHDHDKGMTLLDVLQMLWHLINWRFTL